MSPLFQKSAGYDFKMLQSHSSSYVFEFCFTHFKCMDFQSQLIRLCYTLFHNFFTSCTQALTCLALTCFSENTQGHGGTLLMNCNSAISSQCTLNINRSPFYYFYYQKFLLLDSIPVMSLKQQLPYKKCNPWKCNCKHLKIYIIRSTCLKKQKL